VGRSPKHRVFVWPRRPTIRTSLLRQPTTHGASQIIFVRCAPERPPATSDRSVVPGTSDATVGRPTNGLYGPAKQPLFPVRHRCARPATPKALTQGALQGPPLTNRTAGPEHRDRRTQLCTPAPELLADLLPSEQGTALGTSAYVSSQDSQQSPWQPAEEPQACSLPGGHDEYWSGGVKRNQALEAAPCDRQDRGCDPAVLQAATRGAFCEDGAGSRRNRWAGNTNPRPDRNPQLGLPKGHAPSTAADGISSHVEPGSLGATPPAFTTAGYPNPRQRTPSTAAAQVVLGRQQRQRAGITVPLTPTGQLSPDAAIQAGDHPQPRFRACSWHAKTPLG
jgi:hypothetical protein